MIHRSRLASAGVATALTVATLLVGVPAANAADSATIPDSAPKWLSKATKLGPVPASTAVTATIDLAPKGGEAALDEFVTAVSTPGSASYHQFLTRAEYTAKFAPSTAAVAAIQKYAEAAGFTGLSVADDNASITITGTAGEANSAFGAALQRYTHDGQTVIAPSKNLTVPAAVEALVLGVRGLDTTVDLMKPLAVPAATNVAPGPGYRNNADCSTTYGTKKATKGPDGTALPLFQGKTVPFTVCGYTGAQLRKAYVGGTTTLTGKGIGIAIVDAYASPTITTDTVTYAKRNGDKAYAKGQLGQDGPGAYTDTDDCDAAGWFGEQTLDIEAAHAIAPDASIKYVAAASCNNSDLLAALTKAVNKAGVNIVSNSYGSSSELLSSTSAYESLFKKAAAIGVSVLFSSGDSGDSSAAVGIKTVGYPASSPNATAVGGTATAIGSSGTITATTGWGTNLYNLSSDKKSWSSQGFQYGAGGGTSSVFSKPSYQSSISGSGRLVPDVAMDADPTTGMLIGQTQTFSNGVYYDEYRIGGTSLASPLFAGALALAAQNAGGGGLGFINPTVYANRSAFTDVKDSFPDTGDVRADFVNGEDSSGGYSYTVRTFADDSSLPTTTGYDKVTGVGVPNAKFISIFG